MGDRAIIRQVFESKTLEQLELPAEAADSPTLGSNPIPLTPTLVNAVLAALRAGKGSRQIKKTVKDGTLSLSYDQIKLIIRLRRKIYGEMLPEEEPETP